MEGLETKRNSKKRSCQSHLYLSKQSCHASSAHRIRSSSWCRSRCSYSIKQHNSWKQLALRHGTDKAKTGNSIVTCWGCGGRRFWCCFGFLRTSPRCFPSTLIVKIRLCGKRKETFVTELYRHTNYRAWKLTFPSSVWYSNHPSGMSLILQIRGGDMRGKKKQKEDQTEQHSEDVRETSKP